MANFVSFMKKKVKLNPHKRKKTIDTESNGVEIIYTNAYSNPMPKLNRFESSDREEEEKASFEIEQCGSLSLAKLIDSKDIINSCTEQWILNEIKDIILKTADIGLQN